MTSKLDIIKLSIIAFAVLGGILLLWFFIDDILQITAETTPSPLIPSLVILTPVPIYPVDTVEMPTPPSPTDIGEIQGEIDAEDAEMQAILMALELLDNEE